jgi:dTDP-4-amino-4,6-dideoxygalactose transaminase
MFIPFVDLRTQYQNIKDEVNEVMDAVIEDTAFVGGKYVEKFETEFAEFCDASYCIGMGNGTDAIYVVFKMLGIGSGDEVITAANSFIASSESISLTGAKVVFCDVSEKTRNIDPELIEAKITDKTRAIMPVHLYGQPSDMDSVMEIADRYNLRIVEDCAQAHGAEFKSRKTGTFGAAACFSFYPGKNLGAYGDGGAIITNDSNLAEKIRMFANHGSSEKYYHEFEGINSRLDGLQAAVLSIKLKYLTEWNLKRNINARMYNDKLKDIKQIITPVISDDRDHVFHLYVIRTKHRNDLKHYLQEKGVSCGIHYPIALPNLKAYSHFGHKPKDFPISSMLQDDILSLPMYPELAEGQIDYIIDNINNFYSNF